MITKSELNEDQRKSFDQMTSDGGFSEEEALERIQEICIEKGFTGFRSHKFRLTPEGQKVARELARQ